MEAFKMLRALFTAACATSVALAAPMSTLADRHIPDNTRLDGTNNISVISAQALGYQTANNSCSHRGVGFAGPVSGTWYAIFGDTFWCKSGVRDPKADPSGFHGMVRDAVSQLTTDPLKVVDLGLNADSFVPHQSQLIPYNSDWGETAQFGFGGTSLAETDASSATAALFYVVNATRAGLRGAGVAKVEVVDGTPTVTARFGINGYWWDAKTQARYGDQAAYRDEKSDYIYAWGGPPTSVTDRPGSSLVYMARVRAADSFDLSMYEYWWGRQQGWKPQVLTTFNAETAVMASTGQGQVFWSPFYGCYVFVHASTRGSGPIFLRTVPSPEGPWTADVQVYQARPLNGGLVHAGVAYPYLDTTGQTLVIGFTNNNRIEVVKLTFRK
ncbi:hypothetical protein GQ53DRAFT_847776 [Thozetella sp. PMI_491]|nr:hypothetical protein GQ53DRAFT_847776 [Thozetella sp. PMI_491]